MKNDMRWLTPTTLRMWMMVILRPFRMPKLLLILLLHTMLNDDVADDDDDEDEDADSAWHGGDVGKY
ncbi:unnamed protein product [Ceratitis capitata]|uniref:(Mediterranean fruit fly) hypothetical protein n=1 Tax=Ceratitis capitata TaxID=7213 RepID=A0A811UF21_CERCA|nr:unnamed protein product [Ceratitis capitata]